MSTQTTLLSHALELRLISLAKSGVQLTQIATILAVDVAVVMASMKSMPPPQDVDLTDSPDIVSLYDYNQFVQSARVKADQTHRDKARCLLNNLLNTAQDIVDSGENLSLRGVTDAMAVVYRIAQAQDDNGRKLNENTQGAAPSGNTIVHVNLGGLLTPRGGNEGVVVDGGLHHANVLQNLRPVLNGNGQVTGIQEGDDIKSLESMTPEALRELASRNTAGTSDRAAKLGEKATARKINLRDVLKQQTEKLDLTNTDVDTLFDDVDVGM